MKIIRSIKQKIQGLEIELRYALKKQNADKVLEHWRIRELEIKQDLKSLNLKLKALTQKGKRK